MSRRLPITFAAVSHFSEAENWAGIAAWKGDPEMKSFLYSPQSVKRPGEPEEVAALVRSLFSDEAVVVAGVTWPIDHWTTA